MAQLTPQERLQIKIEEAEIALKLAESAERAAQALTDQDKKLQSLKSATEQKLAAEERAVAAAKTQVALLTEELKASGTLTDQQKDFLKNSLKVLQSSQLRLDSLKDIVKTQEKEIKYQKILAADADEILTKYFGITSETKQFAESLEQAGGLTNLLKDRASKVKQELGKVSGKAVAVSAAFKVAKDLMKIIGGTAMELAKITAEPVKQAVNFENAVRKGREEIDEFRLAARDLRIIEPGGIEEFRKRSMALSDTFRGTQADVRNINIELDKTSNAFRELRTANDPAADSLVKTSFLLQRRLNIPLSQTAKLTEITSQAFGMSAKESEGFAASLSVLATDMGLNVQQVFSDFQSQANNLAKFGLPDIQAEFLELSKIQQMTGISIDNMVSSLEKFTTFEGALTAASQLNAVFGTTIDGLELMDTVMTEGPVEGFIKLRETLEASGIQIDELNFAQMRQLSSTIGLSAEQMRKFGEVSAAELRNITAGSISAEEAMGKLSAAQGEGETIAELQKKATDELVKAMNELITKTHEQTQAMLEMAGKSPKAASALEKFIKPAIDIGIGLGATVLTGGNVVAGYAAYTASDAVTSQIFAPGDNYISKPTVAKVGEVGTENIMRASQIPQTVAGASGMTTVLNTGDKVVRNPTGGGSTNLTINLVGKEGKILDTSSQTISQGEMDKAISHYLNTKVSLLNS